jgi:hypothetical protein
MTTVPEFLDKVKREVGFGLVPTFQQAFAGVDTPADTLVFDLSGKNFAKGQKEDVMRWNVVWNKHAAAAYKENLGK